MSTDFAGAERSLLAPERLVLGRRRSPEIDLRALEHALRDAIDGEVRFDRGSLGLYAVDASNYRHVPLGVVVPKSRADVVRTHAVCRAHGAPIVARGGGTGLAGQTSNRAVVIDFSKYLNRVLSVDPVRRVARVEPGTICDDLVERTTPHRLTFGPQPATHDRCCFGGMLANNSGGVHAQMNGTASNNVESMDVLLYDGTELSVGWMDDDELRAFARRDDAVGRIYRRLSSLRDRYGDLVRASYPKLPRRVSGYNLDQLLPGPDGRFNVARALVGSEGTLVTMLEAEVLLIDQKPKRTLAVIGFEDVYQAGDAVPGLLEHDPVGLEGIDRRLHENIEAIGGAHADLLPLLPDGEAWLFVEIGSDDEAESRRRAERVIEEAKRLSGVVAAKLVEDEWEQESLWEVRESGLGATAFVPGEPDAWPGWEDSAVPPERLGEYLRGLRRLFDAHGYDPALYGHFGQGCVHCRIDFDLSTPEGVADFRLFLDEAADLCISLGGSLSGEHGDGQSRAELLGKMFGAELVEAFGAFKAIWDPEGKMNPGRIVDPRPIVADLRLGPTYAPWEPKVHFSYPQDHGSFAHATTRCVGIGKCRRLSSEGDATMCPSFMVTREEKHTTRGRAHLLWEMLNGDPKERGFRDEAVKESLDLCLACKGCKSDCPVNVDMATYKAEFLSHYFEGRLRPRSAYALGLIDRWASLGSLVPGLVNLATQTPGVRAVAKLAAGIAPSRDIPAFAPETFQRWFARRSPSPTGTGARRAVLWPDTFNNHFFPGVARAAVTVLEHAGFDVVVPEGHVCCGRPLYDFGMLDTAKRYLERVLDEMQPHIEAGRPIVVLEPSCASVFRDELEHLLPHRGDAKKLASQTFLLSELLAKSGYDPPKLRRSAIVQGHCHHKSVMGLGAERRILDGMGLDHDVLSSGCCGMAGAFGFERDKVGVSVAAGERVLLPAVRRAPPSTLVLADGFSCKEQIAQTTDRQALHLAEALAIAIEHGDAGPATTRPEDEIVRRRADDVRRSMRRAALWSLAALSAAAVTGWIATARRRVR